MPLCPWRTAVRASSEHGHTLMHTRVTTPHAQNSKHILSHSTSRAWHESVRGKKASPSFCVFARVVSDRPQRAQHHTVKPSQACGSRTEQSADAAVVDSSSSRAEHAAFAKGLDTVPSVGDGTGAGAPGAGGSRARAGSGAEAGAKQQLQATSQAVCLTEIKSHSVGASPWKASV